MLIINRNRTLCFLFLFTACCCGKVVGGQSGAGESRKIRCLRQTEVLRITDEKGDFVFNQIHDIRTDGTGRIFVKGKKQLLTFDRQGHFIANFFKPGQGPGEIMRFGGFACNEKGLVLCSLGPLKIISMDRAGQVQKEIRINSLEFFTPYAFCFKNCHYLFEDNLGIREANTGICRRVHSLIRIDARERVQRTGLVFINRYALVKRPMKKGGIYVSMQSISPFFLAFDGRRYLYVCYEERYGVDQVDMESMQVVKKINCDFSAVPYVQKNIDYPEKEILEGLADKKYFNDIQALRCLGQDLLVFTASIDVHKGVRVDRFNSEGMRTDAFFLKIPDILRPDDLKKKPLHVQPGFFWTTLNDEDENPVVVKYRVNW